MEIDKLLAEYKNYDDAYEITPAFAKQILDNWPEDSRPPNEEIVNKYTELMKSGKWVAKEDSPIIICLSDEGDWDGKHRLLAFIKSGIAKLKSYFTIHMK